MNDLADLSNASRRGAAAGRDLVARAFAFRRALRTVPAAAGLRAAFVAGCDGLLLSLILDLSSAETLRVENADLAAALAAAMGTGGPSFVDAVGPSANVTLLPFRALDGLTVAPDGTVVVHDVPSVLPLGGSERLALLLLSQVSAATWRSRLALACPPDDVARAAALLARLRGLLDTAELDPLFLLDALNERRTRTRDAALPSDDPEALAARCRSLERRVRELEMSGLARQQSRLADAALRRTHET